MQFQSLHWPAILFGSASGLFTSLVLFALLAGLGSNTLARVALMLLGFFVAGVVAGRFSLVDPELAGSVSALILFFVLAAITVSGGTANLVAIAVFGVGAAALGPVGGSIGHRMAG